MKLEKDQIVYWANALRVDKCTVVEPFEGEWSTTQFCVLVLWESFNQEVYLLPGELYFTEEAATKRFKLNKELKDLRIEDTAAEISKLMLGEKK